MVLPNGHLALPNNESATFPITYKDSMGNVVPKPMGDVATVVPSGQFAASMTVTLGADQNGNALVTLAAAVLESDAGNGGGGIGLTLTDTSGLPEDSASAALVWDIVVPPPGPPASEGFDVTSVMFAPVTPPTAAGP